MASEMPFTSFSNQCKIDKNDVLSAVCVTITS